MKLLTGFTPKALLTANRCYRPTPPKQQLIELIQFLDVHGLLTDYNARLLNAIAKSLFWDKESYSKVEALGLQLAREQFDLAFMNTENEESISSPENPDNWNK